MTYQKQKKTSTEEGSISLLLVGLCALLLLIASVTIAITSVHIERQKLQSLADQTSSAVAVSLEKVELSGDKPQAQLTDQHVIDTSSKFLTSSGAYSEFEGLTLGTGTRAGDNLTAQVQLSCYVHLPLVSIVLPEGVPIEVTGSARSTLEQGETR